jgi:hypothetical protein
VQDSKREELKSIRKSLSTLGYIIKSLAKGVQARMLPYRDSMLTYLLKDALSGSHFSIMLATISPSSTAFDETLSTLRYAEHLSYGTHQHRSSKFNESSIGK